MTGGLGCSPGVARRGMPSLKPEGCRGARRGAWEVSKGTWQMPMLAAASLGGGLSAPRCSKTRARSPRGAHRGSHSPGQVMAAPRTSLGARGCSGLSASQGRSRVEIPLRRESGSARGPSQWFPGALHPAVPAVSSCNPPSFQMSVRSGAGSPTGAAPPAASETWQAPAPGLVSVRASTRAVKQSRCDIWGLGPWIFLSLFTPDDLSGGRAEMENFEL